MEWEPEACTCQLELTEAQKSVQVLQKYVYEPLNSEECFRLFEVNGGHGGDAIEGRLISVDPTKHVPIYFAISYAWGNAQKPHLINCGGQTCLPITCNLFCALNRLRPPDASSKCLYFADALCIDQSTNLESKKERAAQVRLMNKIFTLARLVFIDLGPRAESFEPALKFLTGFSKLQDNQWKMIERAPLLCYASSIIPNVRDSIWDEVMELSVQRWFTRLWIVQEVVLAESAVIVTMSGDHYNLQELQSSRTSNKSLRSWSIIDLHQGLKRVSSFFNKLPPDVAGRDDDKSGDFDRYWSIIGILSDLRTPLDSMLSLVGYVKDRKNPNCDILRLLVQTQNFQKTDIKDTVYALMGLVSLEDTHDILISYDVAHQELSRSITRHLLLKQDGIRWMLYCFASCDIKNHLPSWMLDITKQPAKPTSLARAVVADYISYTAGGRGNQLTWSSDTTDDNLLTISGGFFLDAVIEIAAHYPMSREIATKLRRMGDILPDELRVWFKETETMLSRFIPSFDSSLEAQVYFRRTLICGGATLANPPIVGEAAVFQHCLAHFYNQDELLRPIVSYPDSWPLPDPMEPGEIQEAASTFLQHCLSTGFDQRLCVTRERRLALVPETVQKDDEIVVFVGAPTPLVLRRHESDRYQLVGPAYVEGFMHGESLDLPTFAKRDIVFC